MSVKLLVRDVYAALLAKIPLGWLEPIRLSYGQRPYGSAGRRFLELVLRLLRYRAVDASIAQFFPPGRPDIELVNANSVIARRVFWLGLSGWEGQESACWEMFCARAQRIVEIGANIGVYTVLGAKAAGEAPYIAVEPHPISRRVLQRNVAVNHLANVTVLAAAVVGAQRAATMTLLVPRDDPDGAPAGAYLSEGGERGRDLTRSEYTVPVVEARAVVNGADLIKLDVEGYEYEILSSISPYVEASRPTIFVEVLTNTPRLRALLVKWIQEAAYTCYVPSGEAFKAIPTNDLQHADLLLSYGTRDVILSVQSLRQFG